MTEYTTLKIKKETKSKLDLIKKDRNMSYNDLIEEILTRFGGETVEDVFEIKPDKVALSLRYMDLKSPDIKTLDITFKDLRDLPVGTEFIPKIPDENLNCTYSKAKIVYKETDDVILLMTDVVIDNNHGNSFETSILHISLF